MNRPLTRAHVPPVPPTPARVGGGSGARVRETTWRIDLRDKGGAQPIEQRLRLLLKIAGRGFGLDCVEIREVGTGTPAVAVDGNGRHNGSEG
jgi:hypothetical protein